MSHTCNRKDGNIGCISCYAAGEEAAQAEIIELLEGFRERLSAIKTGYDESSSNISIRTKTVSTVISLLRERGQMSVLDENELLTAESENIAIGVAREQKRIVAILDDPAYYDLGRAHLIGVIQGASLDSEWD